MIFHLVIEPASGGRFEHRLAAGAYTVGREEGSCDIPILSPEISPRHARLTLGPGRGFIEDLGSELGTFIDGQPVSGQQVFSCPCEIHLGTARLQIASDEEDAGETLPGAARKGMATAAPFPTVSSIQTPNDGHDPAAGHYTKGREIARGGMGAILEANDQLLGRTVAMKVVLQDRMSEDAHSRFVREATVLARLEHPNIIPIHEMGKDADGNLFYTMKMVEGRTLQAILDAIKTGDAATTIGHYTLDRLLTIFRKVCDAMAFAHSKGIIHRDLKPENIMVGAFGEVLVMDWGLAKVLEDAAQNAAEARQQSEASVVDADAALEESPLPSGFEELTDSQMPGASQALTMDGTVMGSPRYMSPEQAEGRIRDIDERSDIFSLGGLLYAILTLRPPVEGRTVVEVLENVKSGRITPPTHFNTGSSTDNSRKLPRGRANDPKRITSLPHCPGGHVPPALSSVCMKALSLDPEHRYPAVAELSRDVEQWQGGFATRAENAGFATQIRLLVQRNQRVVAIGFGAWLVITGLAIWFVVNLRAKERRAVNGEESAKAAQVVAVQKEGETRKALARSALSLAEAALREGNGPAMRDALGTVPEESRDSTWRHLLRQADTSIARIGVGEVIQGVVAHPRLPSVFVMVDLTGKVTIQNVRTGERFLEFAAELPRPAYSFTVAISPNGERIAVGHRAPAGGIVIHNARDGKKTIAWEANPSAQLEFSADGRLLLQRAPSGPMINLWNTTNGQLRWNHVVEGQVTGASFTPYGKEVSLRGTGAATRLLRVEDGTVVRKFSNHIYTSMLRPDGRAVVGGERDGTITGFDLTADREVFRFRTDGREIQRIVFAAEGTRFVSVAVLSDGRQAIRIWDTTTGAPVQSLLGGSGPVNDASVHPLTGELVVCGSETRVWSLGGARWTLRHERISSLSSLAFWAADNLVLGPVRGKQTALLRLTGSSPETLWTSPNADYNLTDVSADGRFAAMGVFRRKGPFLLFRRSGEAVEQVGTFTASQSVNRIQISPSGRRLAAMVTGWGFVEVFDTTAGGQPVKLGQGEVKLFNDFRWLSQEHLLGLVTANARRGVANAEERIVVWDVTTGEILRRAANASAMNVLAIAPDGRRFAEAGTDKSVRIRDVATLAVLKEFRVHDDAVTALAWHPKKPILATGSADLTIRLWNLDTGERIDEFRGPLAPPLKLAFSPSGQRLGCASEDATTRIWDPPSLRDQTAPPLEAGEGVMDEHVWFAKTLLGAPPGVPVTIRPEADGWTDLLASLKPETVEKTGHGWRLEQGELLSPAARYATVPLPGDLSGASYQAQVKLRRRNGAGGFHVVLPVGPRMTGFELDGPSPGGGNVSSLLLVHGKYGEDVAGFVDGRQINDTVMHELAVTVRLDGARVTISVTLDAKPLYEWTGPITALSQPSDWAKVTEPGSLALGSHGPIWAVSGVKVRRLATNR